MYSGLDADRTKVRAEMALATDALNGAGIESARFETQLLLALALGVARSSVVAETFPEPSEAQWVVFRHLVADRQRRVPLAYLRGSQEFYGLPFQVSPAVLIPRPETELLVEFALSRLQETADPARAVLADVGTGSGAIAIAFVAHANAAHAIGFDISETAITVARNNARLNAVSDRIRFVRSDLLTGVKSETIDILVSNPPYIPTSEIPLLQDEVRIYEPWLALDGGPEGLDLHRRLATDATRVLRPNGWLAVEVAQGQAPAVMAIFAGCGLHQVATKRDLQGIDRIVCGCKT